MFYGGPSAAPIEVEVRRTFPMAMSDPCGDGRIRTHGGVTHNCFQDSSHSPLGHVAMSDGRCLRPLRILLPGFEGRWLYHLPTARSGRAGRIRTPNETACARGAHSPVDPSYCTIRLTAVGRSQQYTHSGHEDLSILIDDPCRATPNCLVSVRGIEPRLGD